MKHCALCRACRAGRKGSGGSSPLQKSRSLEDPESSAGGGGGPGSGGDALHGTYHPAEYHLDLRRQLETVQQEARVLQEKLGEMERANEQLVTENKKLQILSGRISTGGSAAAAAGKSSAATKSDGETV